MLCLCYMPGSPFGYPKVHTAGLAEGVENFERISRVGAVWSLNIDSKDRVGIRTVSFVRTVLVWISQLPLDPWFNLANTIVTRHLSQGPDPS
jgi:hypothetical protein